MTVDPPFRATGEDVVYQSRLLRVARGRFVAPDGAEFERDIVHHPGWVAVVPLTDDGHVVCVRQYRAALGTWLLEIPAGIRDVDGEAPELTARRELAEEAGVAAEQVELVATIHNSPGFADERGSVFLATGLTGVPTDRQGPEEGHMEVVRVPLSDVPRMITAGEVTDAKSVVGLLLAVARCP
ncbi:MAG TPA: NUDIX hydrolase [Acidimicrobiales bacterium]|nr:NUDIX hydrolase [Acidimicrobiales bacterium]